MEYVEQHLCAIVKEMSLGTSQQSSSVSVALSSVASQDHRASGLADLYALLGREHVQAALQLVDEGIACLVCGSRVLFRVGGKFDNDTACYCVLPGRLCSACTQPAVGSAFCVHTTAVLLAAAQSRYSTEDLTPKSFAALLFDIVIKKSKG
ncbi:hypothetical protein GGI25_000661 [Coemansia spiralis]|uniref:Uncharacterized protein n=2 Tax=Coemansia TaxID=4863 RepID=A0A9W8L068_9FUNG|nr:hypothetical protein BX070DRAFT_245087 [Coemansia spiralis]KAJ1995681.1 hypothetical protein EDC05_000615 [Coemansia umbellata]KAJ2623713.1 hypothetical protein GGI26_002160 [Coemansia sp. RSA 1358]KAJ2680369.1 hypothetical protein GGI25_000661 [Coemansia spiralis]